MHKLLSWMSQIFYLSHKPATESSELSSSVTEVIINAIVKGDLLHIARGRMFISFII